MSPSPAQVALAQKYGKQFGVDPKLLLAIGGHETQWGAAGAGRANQGGYVLGYGVTDSQTLSKYAGVENQYRYAAQTLASWGVHTIADIKAGKAAKYATDPAWETGVMAVYAGLGGKIPATPVAPPTPVAGSSSGRTPVSETGGGGSSPSPATPSSMTPQDYRRQAALGALAGIAQGQKPTDTLTGVVESFRQHPITMPTTTPRTVNPPVTKAEEGSSLGQAIVKTAAQEIGQPYVWGGESKAEGGFDCSGLVDFAMRQHGYKGGRITTETIKNMGRSVLGQDLAPGDLVLNNGGNHVVIYAGNGRVISAPHAGAKVRYQRITDYKITDIRRPY